MTRKAVDYYYKEDFFKRIFIFGICILILTNSDFSNILI